MPEHAHTPTPPADTTTAAGRGGAAARHLDDRHAAGRAITNLVTRITQLQERDGDWPGAELVTLLEDWLRGIGLDPDQLPTPPPAAATTGHGHDDAAAAAAGADREADRWWPTPALRASWAAAALGTHHRRSGPGAERAGAGLPTTDEDLAPLCADLIADVLHLLGGAGLPVWAVLSRAIGYFQAEDAQAAATGLAATTAAAAANAAAAGAAGTGHEAPETPDGAAGYPLHLEEVARLVRDAGVHCVLDTSGGGVATLWAGPTRRESGYGIRSAALAGPGSYAAGAGAGRPARPRSSSSAPTTTARPTRWTSPRSGPAPKPRWPR